MDRAKSGARTLGASIRLATPFFNIYGTLTIVGGALYSGYLFYRKKILPNRVLGNVLIAAGSLAVASAGILNRFGAGQFHSFAQLFFAVLMYYGFILASRYQQALRLRRICCLSRDEGLALPGGLGCRRGCDRGSRSDRPDPGCGSSLDSFGVNRVRDHGDGDEPPLLGVRGGGSTSGTGG